MTAAAGTGARASWWNAPNRGVEAAYIGNARNIDALGLDGNARLISNGAEGALRLEHSDRELEPDVADRTFGFVGLGWSHYNVTIPQSIPRTSPRATTSVPCLSAAASRSGTAQSWPTRASPIRKIYNNDLVTAGAGHWGIGGQIGFGF
jgi:hypothetical protein